jgi:hypothetical protein
MEQLMTMQQKDESREIREIVEIVEIVGMLETMVEESRRRKRRKVKIKTANLDPRTIPSNCAARSKTLPNFLHKSAASVIGADSVIILDNISRMESEKT